MGFLCNIAESNKDKKKTAAESLICFPRGYTQSDKILITCDPKGISRIVCAQKPEQLFLMTYYTFLIRHLVDQKNITCFWPIARVTVPLSV